MTTALSSQPNIASSFMGGFSEAYLADIGRFIAAWSQVEQQFDMLYLRLVVAPQMQVPSTRDPAFKMLGQPFDTRCRELRERVDKMPLTVDGKHRWARGFSTLAALRHKRDEVAHAHFSLAIDPGLVIRPDAGVALTKSWKNQKPHRQSLVTSRNLRRLFDRTHLLFWDMVDLSLDPLGERDENPYCRAVRAGNLDAVITKPLAV